MSPNDLLPIGLRGTWSGTGEELWVSGGLWCGTIGAERQLRGYRWSLSPAFRAHCWSPILRWHTLVSQDLGGAAVARFGSFLCGFQLHYQILLLLISLLPVQVSQRVGAFPGSGRLWGSIQVLTAAAGKDGGLSLGFAQPQQVEALQGGFNEEAFWELCALVPAVLLQGLC